MNSEDEAPRNLPVSSFDIVNAIADIILCISRDGIIRYANTSACAALHIAQRDVLNRPFAIFLKTSDHTAFNEQLKTCFEKECAIEREFDLDVANEKAITALLHFAYFKSHSEEENAVCIITVHDLTERKQLELQLLRMEHAAYFATSPITVSDPDVKVLFANPAFEQATGYSKEEVLNIDSKGLARSLYDKEVQEEVFAGIKTHKPFKKHITGWRKNGDIYYTILEINPVFSKDGKWRGSIAAHRDITENKFLEHRLIHAQKMESIGLLASGIAHEVGNPLASISAIVQVLQRSLNDAATHEKLELIKNQVLRVNRTLRDMVDFSRKSSHVAELVDINKSLLETVEIVRVGKKAKSIAFSMHLDPNLPALFLIADQLQQVFINILINGIDAVFDSHKNAGAEPAGAKAITITTGMREENAVIIIGDVVFDTRNSFSH